jgi:hypothetical protein
MIACLPSRGQKSDYEHVEQLDFDSYRPVYTSTDIDSLLKLPPLENDTLYIKEDGRFMAGSFLKDSLVSLMDTLGKLNRSVPYRGYRIVLYTGPERQEAIYARGKAMKILEEGTEVYMNYQQPYFRVKIGNYNDRISAYATFVALKKVFPTALLVPDIIELDKIQFE